MNRLSRGQWKKQYAYEESRMAHDTFQRGRLQAELSGGGGVAGFGQVPFDGSAAGAAALVSPISSSGSSMATAGSCRGGLI